MATTSRRESARVHVSGVFDGSGAMKLVNYLRGERGADVVVDFADVERFEAFGIDVLLNQLGPASKARVSPSDAAVSRHASRSVSATPESPCCRRHAIRAGRRGAREAG